MSCAMANSKQRRSLRRALVPPLSDSFSSATKTGEPTQEMSGGRTKQNNAGKSKNNRIMELLGICASVLGIVTGLFSFFPHLAVSDPIQMNANDFFFYQMTITNDGVLPVFDVNWALAPKIVSVRAGTGTLGTPESKANMLFIYPGSAILGPEDYSFHLRRSDSGIGMLAPGDGYTFTTEHLIAAPSGAAYDDVDFAIAVSYIPIFPPIPMQTCSRFRMYQDRQGIPHWFRSPNQCNRFPWLHHWFQKSSVPP
jgi:hypothetical protein